MGMGCEGHAVWSSAKRPRCLAGEVYTPDGTNYPKLRPGQLVTILCQSDTTNVSHGGTCKLIIAQRNSWLQELLQGKWLAMAGDSIARSLYAALLRLFDDDASSDSRRVAYGHQSFEYTLPGNIRASFVWAPYTANVTEHIRTW